MGNVYFDGDPAVDSSRRHMERVLKGEPRSKWPWLVAAVGGGGLFALWRMGEQLRIEKQRPAAEPPAQPPTP